MKQNVSVFVRLLEPDIGHDTADWQVVTCLTKCVKWIKIIAGIFILMSQHDVLFLSPAFFSILITLAVWTLQWSHTFHYSLVSHFNKPHPCSELVVQSLRN